MNFTKMELDSRLHRVQSALKNEQRLLGNLTAIKADNEDSITKIVLSLKKVIGGAEEFDSKNKEKLFILLFLNADTEMYNDLRKNRKYTHLVGFLPKLSQDLFMKLVVNLELHQCLYEALTGFCPSLSHLVANLCLNSLNWLDLFEAVSFVENVIASLFLKMFLTGDKDKFDIPLKDTFQKLLLHYDAEKSGCIKRMSRWKSAKLKHYAGLIMASLLSLLEKCTNIYSKKTHDLRVGDYLCNLTIDEESINTRSITENRPFSVQQCYEHIVAKCYENICSVTVDLWLFWVEIDLDDVPDTENTLQRLIGEKAYTCREALKEAECAGVSSKEASDLILKLKSLALKPRSEDFDGATPMSLDSILTNIQDTNKDTKKWLKFLINSPFNVGLPLSALEVVRKYISQVESVDLKKLGMQLILYIKSSEDGECTFHKQLLLEIVDLLDVDSQMTLLNFYIENLGLSDVLKTEEFQPEFVEAFNKVINEDDKEKELHGQFLKLALQSPKTVITKTVAEGITSELRGHLMAGILGSLQPFCDAPCSEESSLLIEALTELLDNLQNLPETHQTNYAYFVRELVMRKNLEGEKFIRICLMKKIHQHLSSKNWVQMTTCLESVTELCDINCFYYCPASLVMMMQVVQASRWTPGTFSMAAVRVCELALVLVNTFVSKWIETGYEEKHLRNLTVLVKHRISPLNRYHLYRLMSEEPMPTDPAQQLLYRMHYGIGEWSVLQVSPEERTKLVYALCYVLPILTSHEWQELFCVVTPKCSEFLCLFHIVTDALLLCVDSAKMRSSSDVMSCLGFALLNVANVIKYEVNRWNQNDNEYRISVLSKMCQLVAAFPTPQQEEFGLTLVKVLQQLLPEGSRRQPLSAEEMNTVTASLAVLQATDLRQTLAREFLDMVHR